jgi:hypothetical protein
MCTAIRRRPLDEAVLGRLEPAAVEEEQDTIRGHAIGDGAAILIVAARDMRAGDLQVLVETAVIAGVSAAIWGERCARVGEGCRRQCERRA